MKPPPSVRDQLAALSRRKPAPVAPTARAPSKLRALFDNAWRALDGPALVEEYVFALPRLWRFDYVHESGVAVELEGGVWSGGRHTHPTGFEDDIAKYNRACALGFRVFRVTRKMLDEDPVGALGPIIAATVARPQPVVIVQDTLPLSRKLTAKGK